MSWGHFFQRDAAVGDRMMELLEHQVECRQDRLRRSRRHRKQTQDFTQDAVDLVLHVLHFIDGCRRDAPVR